MNILHTVSSLGQKSYGIGQICMSLASIQNNIDLDVNVLSVDNSYEELLWSSQKYKFPIERINNCHYSYFQLLKMNRKNDFIHSLGNISRIDIVHQHSLWGKNSLLLSEFRNKGIPYVIAPHGTLSPYALHNRLSSKVKKKIALNLSRIQYPVCQQSTFHDFPLESSLSRNTDSVLMREIPLPLKVVYPLLFGPVYAQLME